MADFDVQGARKSGYSDAEIADYLAGSKKFDVGAARQAGYSDAEIIEHLSPGPGMVRRTLSAAGDAVKTADDYITTQAIRTGAGLASLPGAIGKGIEWGYNQIGVKPEDIYGPEFTRVFLRQPTENWPTAKTISDTLHAAAKKTPTNLEGNIPGGKIIDSAVQGAMGALLTGGTSLPALLAGAGGGALSEGAGQIAHEVAPDYETLARVIGAGVGGVGGAVTPSIVRKGADAIKATVAPFTAAGRERIAGGALRNAAANADDAVVALDRYQIGREAFPDAVPGFRIDAGKASRDPGLMAVAETAAAKSPGMRAQVQTNNALATGALDDAFAGLPTAKDAGSLIQTTLADRFKAAVDARKAAADPYYTAARASSTPVDPTDAWMIARQVANEGKGKPQQTMQKVAGYFESGADTPKKLMATRDAVTTLLDNPKLDNYRKSLLQSIKGKIDDALSVVPEEQQARATFQQYSKPLEPFGADTAAGAIVKKDRFGNLVTPAEKATGDLSGRAVQNIMMASGGDPTVKRALQSAFFDDFKKSALSSVQEDAAGNRMLLASGASKWLEKNKGAAANVLTADQVKALDDVARNLRDQAQAVPGRTGSPTFDRLASESILGAIVSKRFGDAPILHPVRRALGLVYGGADEAVMNVIFDAIADPKVASALMKKATPGNVKMVEPLLVSAGRGSALPAITSVERGSP